MIRVCKIMEFEAAHFIPLHKGKCRDLHGHTYKVEVTVQGEMNEGEMLYDFGDLKEKMVSLIDGFLDHKMLNDVFGNHSPTAEFLAQWFGISIDRLLPDYVSLSKVRIWETSTSWAEYVS